MPARIGRAARRAVRQFTWERVIDTLLEKVEFAATSQGACPGLSLAGRGARRR